MPMNKDSMQFDTRQARIYKDIYRPSSNISRFLGTLLSVILVGQSQIGNPDYHHFRKPR
jgi:hypothetical protein